MRLVFIGASKFGLKCLIKTRDLEMVDVVGVVTAPQHFSISYRPEGLTNVLHAEIASYCQNNDTPYAVIQHGMNDEPLYNRVCSWQPEIFLVAGWYHMVPKKWRDLAPAYGLHASLLPDYSGGAPLVWAMINGEKKAGITFFRFDESVDNGPIVGQAQTEILFEDTIATLYNRIEMLGLELITKNMPLLTSNQTELIKQDESRRRIFPQRRPEDGLIDWNRNVMDLYNFIRAQTRPYPGAFTIWKGKQLKIWRVKPTKTPNTSFFNIGVVSSQSKNTSVCVNGGVLDIEEITYNEKPYRGQEISSLLKNGDILRN